MYWLIVVPCIESTDMTHGTYTFPHLPVASALRSAGAGRSEEGTHGGGRSAARDGGGDLLGFGGGSATTHGKTNEPVDLRGPFRPVVKGEGACGVF